MPKGKKILRSVQRVTDRLAEVGRKNLGIDTDDDEDKKSIEQVQQEALSDAIRKAGRIFRKKPQRRVPPTRPVQQNRNGRPNIRRR